MLPLGADEVEFRELDSLLLKVVRRRTSMEHTFEHSFLYSYFNYRRAVANVHFLQLHQIGRVPRRLVLLVPEQSPSCVHQQPELDVQRRKWRLRATNLYGHRELTATCQEHILLLEDAGGAIPYNIVVLVPRGRGFIFRSRHPIKNVVDLYFATNVLPLILLVDLKHHIVELQPSEFPTSRPCQVLEALVLRIEILLLKIEIEKQSPRGI